MRFSLSKESVGYHQVKSYREVQNFLPLLIPTTIPKTSMNCLESTYMPIIDFLLCYDAIVLLAAV